MYSPPPPFHAYIYFKGIFAFIFTNSRVNATLAMKERIVVDEVRLRNAFANAFPDCDKPIASQTRLIIVHRV